jgi:hypothetical protein
LYAPPLILGSPFALPRTRKNSLRPATIVAGARKQLWSDSLVFSK